MYKYILSKSIASFLTLLIIVVLFYLLFTGFKGNPFTIDEFILKHPNDLQAARDAYEAELSKYSINSPVFVRFGIWLKDLFSGSWGPIYKLAEGKRNDTIPQIYFKPLRYSMLVQLPSYFMGMFFGIGLGYWAGYKRGKITDVIINVFVKFFIAIPAFVFGTFVLILAPMLGLPNKFADPNIAGNTTSLFVKSLLPSIIVVTLSSLAGWGYFLRNEVGNVLKSDYVQNARTKGYSEFFIFRRYVLRNSMYPLIGNIVTSYMAVFGGSIIVERIFGIPGTSDMMLEATLGGEINILMFQLIFLSSIGIFSQMIVDIAQFTINPIVKSNFSSKPSPWKKYIAHKKREQARLAAIEGSVND